MEGCTLYIIHYKCLFIISLFSFFIVIYVCYQVYVEYYVSRDSSSSIK